MLYSYGRECLGIRLISLYTDSNTSMVAFLAAFSFLCFTASSLSVRMLLGIVWIVIGVLILWCLIAFWDVEQLYGRYTCKTLFPIKVWRKILPAFSMLNIVGRTDRSPSMNSMDQAAAGVWGEWLGLRTNVRVSAFGVISARAERDKVLVSGRCLTFLLLSNNVPRETHIFYSSLTVSFVVDSDARSLPRLQVPNFPYWTSFLLALSGFSAIMDSFLWMSYWILTSSL